MYNQVIKFQLWLLAVYPGLLPLAAMAVSLLGSWHCALMCGPLIGKSNNKSVSQILATRVVSYTLAGGVFGFFGNQLKNSLEIKMVGAIAFIIFSAVTVFCVLPLIFPVLKNISLVKVLNRYRGYGWAFMPCHLLMFFYGIAVLSSSPVAGSLILLGHAVMTTPALSYTNYILRKVQSLPRFLDLTARLLIIALAVFNLLFFWGVMIASETEAKNKLLFCF